MNPFATTTSLLPHQGDAVAKVLPSRVSGLFMEMGTGKTRTAIELARIRAHRIDRVVWVCPVSLKETIYQEIKKHTNCHDVYVFDDKTRPGRLPDARWYVVGIESLSSSNRVTLAMREAITDRTMVVMDESSYIKGHNSRRTKRLTLLAEKARYRMILTGTPLSQGVVDLYAQARFLSPKILGYRSFYTFAHNHLEYSDRYPGVIVRAHNVPYLASKLAPYVYQVTKSECLDLPDKLYETRYVPLTGEQRRIYEQAKEEILLDLDPDGFDSVTIFRLFTALQSIVCGFWHRLLSDPRKPKEKKTEFLTISHNRLDALLDLVRDLPEEKVIIWAKFRYCADQIVEGLTQEYGSDAIAQFHGGLSERLRASELARFRAGARYLVATQSSGGHGLTLTEAAHAIFYADGFKFSERLQAEDRCHRIGQDRKVLYVSLHAAGTIDDRITTSLGEKGNAMDRFRAEVQKIRRSGTKEDLRKLVMSL